MKKHRISKRIFAMLLVICMVFTMLPANINALAYEKGDIQFAETGVTFGEDKDAYTLWPITIHDYSNDGMLFEYASYTGNTASWAQLDKTGEYFYMPELNAEYYADFTKDEIANTHVMDRWFGVWGKSATLIPDNESGLSYYKFSDFTERVELLDLRDENSDSIPDSYNPKEVDGKYKFDNAYGYTFTIDDVNGTIGGEDATIITSASAYNACNPDWAISVHLRRTENADEYSVVEVVPTPGAGTTADTAGIVFENGDIVMVVHSAQSAPGKYSETTKCTNWMDKVAAEALKEGDIVTLSSNALDTASDEQRFVTVNADANGKKSGVISADKAQYATLVYRTTGTSATTTVSGTVTYANAYDWTNGGNAGQIYVFASSIAYQTPGGMADGTGNFFEDWYGIKLQYNSTTGEYTVTAVDRLRDKTNELSYSAIGTDSIVIMYHDTAETTNPNSYNFLKTYGKIGAKMTGPTPETFQGLSAGSTSQTLYCTVAADQKANLYAYLREPGASQGTTEQSNLKSSEKEEILISGYSVGEDWRYCVFDLSKWKDLEEIQSAGIALYRDNTNVEIPDLEVSHFALFGSEEEAKVYGESALVLNKHHIQTLYPHNATYSTDFTTSEPTGATTLITDWWEGVHKYVVEHEEDHNEYYVSYDSNGRQHYGLNTPWNYHPETELIDFNDIGGVDSGKLQHAVLICRTQDVLYGNEFQIYFRGKSDKDSEGAIIKGEKIYTSGIRTLDSKEAFDVIKFNLSDFQSDTKVYSAGVRMTNYGDYYVDDDGDGVSTGYDTDYTFDIRQFAFFENEDQMNDYIEKIKVYNGYSGVPTSYYNPIYSNLGYGLYEQSSEDERLYNKHNTAIGEVDANDSIYKLETNINNTDTYAPIKLEDYTFDGYKLFGTLTDGGLTAGLIEGTLDISGAERSPVYREETVEYLAKLLESTLIIPESEGGYFNYDFVRGEKLAEYGDRDLASAIRERVGITSIDYDVNKTTVRLGTWTDTEANASNLKGSWEECSEHITTCFDAAYFLLNNLFQDDSYGEKQDTYKYLTLHQATVPDSKGNQVPAYVFDAGFSIPSEDEPETGETALDYNATTHIIDYKFPDTGTITKNQYWTSTNTSTTLFPFLPVREDNTEEKMTKSPYFADPGVGYDGEYGETYYERDFNYVIESHGEFVYDEDEGLFFEFEGDDDVYLFINGQLVLDIGGAHGITKQRFDLNAYVDAAEKNEFADPERNKALSLTDDEICKFDFYYMERHGYGANCRIVTNMVISDPALRVDKTAYQDTDEGEEQEIPYGGVINPEKSVEYGFKLENHGETKLYNLSFEDKDIGVTIDANKGLTVSNDNVTDKDGVDLEATDLWYEIKGYAYTTDEDDPEQIVSYNKNEDGEMVEVTDGTLGDYKKADLPLTKIKSEEELKNLMKMVDVAGAGTGETDATVTHSGSGLWVDATLTIRGIFYTLTDTEKANGKFDNTLYGAATTRSKIGEDGSERLESQDKHRVVVPGKPYYYQWAGHHIIITPETLIENMIASGDKFSDVFSPSEDDKKAGKVALSVENISKIYESSAAGREISTGTVSVNNKNIDVHYTDAGNTTFYIKIEYNESAQYVIVPVTVNVLAVESSYMVLDYGLSVDLTDEDGILKNDYLYTGSAETVAKVVGITDEEPSYNEGVSDGVSGIHKVTFASKSEIADNKENGEDKHDGAFVLDSSNKLTYTPDEFMEEMDTIWAAVHVHEAEDYDAEKNPTGFKAAELGREIKIGKEVQMYKEVSVLPANVVYYEDDFPAIKYRDESKEDKPLFTPANTLTPGDSSNLTQSADQDQEYGQDDAYRTNSDKSGKSLTTIEIGATGKVAEFEFKGTGFELISRTNAIDSATILVQVKDSNGNRTIPVITEFDHNDDGGEEQIYQVPVIRIDGLTYEQHTVTITAAQGVNRSAKLYVDGFRIYNPLAETTVESTGDNTGVATITPGKNEHYNDSENGAVFSEIRNLIMEAKAVVASYTNTTTTINSGTVTWTERHTDEHYDGTPWTVTNTNSINDYLIYGPNNEVYMDGTEDSNTSALVFYVTEDKVGEGSLQIAVRAIDKNLFEGTKTSDVANAKLFYGIDTKGETDRFQWKAVETIEGADAENQGTISSATEQYYTINYRECPYLPGRGYQVAIKVTGGMVSYSSIKSNGLTFEPMNTNEAETTTLRFENGQLVDTATNEVAEESGVLLSLRRSLASDTFYEEEIYVDEKICYQTRNDSDLRLIGYVDDLTKYSSVSFTLTIDGKTTKPLVCTTAYAGLYANGELYTTEDIYKAEGSFVAFTINNYLNVYRGQEVMITITYTSTTGEVHTEARTVTIE